MTNLDHLSAYDYTLPPELIAQEPTLHRDASRLLSVDRKSGGLRDQDFTDLPELLRPGDLLVANQSRVIPARLLGVLPTGGRVELLLIRPQGLDWEVMSKPARRVRRGITVSLPGSVQATITQELPEGRRLVRFSGVDDFDKWLSTAGRMPLPPYIHQYPDDPDRYQTVYALSRGSVAAPTAGLHFTAKLIERLSDKGIETVFITLHVGPGTFKPVVQELLDCVRLEAEQASIPAGTAAAIAKTRSDGRRVIAVGTTTVRTLEGAALKAGEIGAWEGEVDVFIRPPFQFRVVDALITNFHLPKSSLLMLVSAFASRDFMRTAYKHAVDERYRFYSFGDAMFIQ